MDIRTQTLKYFVAVAEEMHFSLAAERLGVSQPAISRQIRLLETDLGTALFSRTGKGVRLTAAGAALLGPARQLLTAWETAQRAARTAAAQEAQVLRVGFVATAAQALTDEVSSHVAARLPGVSLKLTQYGWGGEVAALRQGIVDVAFIWLPTDTTGLFTEIVAREPRVVGMAVTHRLAGRDRVRVADLRGEPMPWARQASREWVNWWAVVPRPDGSEPVWGPPNDNAEELLEYVAAGPGICIVPQSMAYYYPRPDVVWLPLVDAEPLRVAVGWPSDLRSPLVEQFVAIVKEMAEGQEGEEG